MTAMHPLLRLALATCPRDYRREYEESIARDVRTRHESVSPSRLGPAVSRNCDAH